MPLPAGQVLAERAAFLNTLRKLDLSHNPLGPAGVNALLERGIPKLHTLNLRDTDLFDKGATLLAESSAAAGLLELDVSKNSLHETGVSALAHSENLKDLLILRVADNSLGETAQAKLKESPLGEREVLHFEHPKRIYQHEYYDEAYEYGDYDEDEEDAD